MPTTIAQAFEAAGLTREDVGRWGTKPEASAPGVYIVALTDTLDSCAGTLHEAPLESNCFRRWLDACPDLTLDGRGPTLRQLMDRVQRFWLPGEVILYLGCTTKRLSTRLNEYYRTPIGARSPHHGGYFIKLLSNLDQLWVHYAPCPKACLPEIAESRMMWRFGECVRDSTKQSPCGNGLPFPFANLEWTKPHGLGGVCRKRSTRS